jgi:copper(I)-binding protein
VLKTIALLLLAATLAPPAAMAHSHKAKGLEIVHPWTAATEDPHTINVPIFMTIKNRSGTADRLVGASSPLAERVELIGLQRVGASKLPTPVKSLDIPRGKDLLLGPEGPRLLVSGIKKRLNAYDSFELTLVFEKAGNVVVEVVVEEAETTAPHKH